MALLRLPMPSAADRTVRRRGRPDLGFTRLRRKCRSDAVLGLGHRRVATSGCLDRLLGLGSRLADADIATRVALCFGDQRTLVIARGVEAEVAKRASQPTCHREGVVDITAAALEQ